MTDSKFWSQPWRSIKKAINKRLASYLMQQIESPKLQFFNFERMLDELIPGDVILIEGRNRGSEIIKYVTFSPWTHSALYIGPIYKIKDESLRKKLSQQYPEHNEEPLIIESIIGQGTMVNSLKKYNQEHMRICRPIGLAHDDAEKVILFACQQIGKPYNVRRFFDLGRFLLKSKFLPRLWRSSLFATDSRSHSSQEICSTMLAEAFASIEFPIMPLIETDSKNNKISLVRRNPRLFTPCDFDYSPYFNIIKYPIFVLSTDTNAHELPWDQSQISNDELGTSSNNPEKN